MSEVEMRAVAQDWVDALSEFPAWAIGEAATVWLRTEERKPTIAGIRKLCVHHFSVVQFARHKAMRASASQSSSPEDRKPLTEEERVSRKAQMDAVLGGLVSKMEASA